MSHMEDQPETKPETVRAEAKSGRAAKKSIPLACAVWTVGYDGLTAVVDRSMVSASGKGLSVDSLLEKGLFRAAAAAAVQQDSAEGLQKVIAAYNAACGSHRSGYQPEDAGRLFGVRKLDYARFNLL